MTTATARPKARRTSTTTRPRVVALPATPKARAPRRRRAARKGPSIVLTAEGLAGLRAYVERLRSELLDMRELLSDPRRDERLILDAERLIADIDSYEGLIAQADPMDEPAVLASPVIVLGSRVSLTFSDGSGEIVRLVHPSEAFLDDERVSIESPLAKALLGLTAGERAEVKAPAGTMKVTVDAVGADIKARIPVSAA